MPDAVRTGRRTLIAVAPDPPPSPVRVARSLLRRLSAPAALVTGLLALGLLWRTLRYALAFPIWGDEAFLAVNFLVRDFATLFHPLVWGQIAPLGFTWAELAVARNFGVGEYTLRLIPFAAGVAALLVFWRFAAATLPRRAAVLAVGFLAASYYAVRHGSEVKPYATDLLASVVITALAWRVLRRPERGTRWAALVAAAALAPWCSYPSVFVLAAAAIVLTCPPRFRPPLGSQEPTCQRDGRAARFGWAGLAVAIVLSAGAMYLFYARPHAAAAARLTEIQMWRQTFPPVAEPSKLPLWFVAIHAGNMFAYPVGGKAPGSIVTLMLFVVGCAAAWRSNRTWLALLLLPFGLTFAAAALEMYPYGGSVRTSIYLAPAICALSGLGLATIFRRIARRTRLRVAHAMVAACCVLAAICVGGMVRDVREPFKDDAVRRSREAVLAVARATGPWDRWIVFNAIEPVAHAPWLGDWRGTGGQFVFDMMRFAPVSLEWAPPPESFAAWVTPSVPADRPQGGPPPGSPIGPDAGRAGRVWLFSYRGSKSGVVFPEGQFEEYRGALSRRLGEPVAERRFVIKEDGDRLEALDVYRFDPRD